MITLRELLEQRMRQDPLCDIWELTAVREATWEIRQLEEGELDEEQARADRADLKVAGQLAMTAPAESAGEVPHWQGTLRLRGLRACLEQNMVGLSPAESTMLLTAICNQAGGPDWEGADLQARLAMLCDSYDGWTQVIELAAVVLQAGMEHIPPTISVDAGRALEAIHKQLLELLTEVLDAAVLQHAEHEVDAACSQLAHSMNVELPEHLDTEGAVTYAMRQLRRQAALWHDLLTSLSRELVHPGVGPYPMKEQA